MYKSSIKTDYQVYGCNKYETNFIRNSEVKFTDLIIIKGLMWDYKRFSLVVIPDDERDPRVVLLLVGDDLF